MRGKQRSEGGDGGHQPTASGEDETFVSETTWMMLLLRYRYLLLPWEWKRQPQRLAGGQIK